MQKKTNRLAKNKKTDRREAKQAKKEFVLEDDAQPSLRFFHEELGEMALFFNGTFGLCYKKDTENKESTPENVEELVIFTRTQPLMYSEFGDPARVLALALTSALDLLTESAGRDLALHMFKAQIDRLVETTPLKDPVARKTLRKYKMNLDGSYKKP